MINLLITTPQVDNCILECGTQEIFKIIREINQEGTTILLVEQNANMALQVAQYGYVLETGRVALHGDTNQLLQDQHVKETYLGIKRE